MKLRQVNYEENDDEKIKDITVTLSFNEAVAIVNIARQLNGHARRKLQLSGDDSLYDTLASVFNGQYEDGAPDLNIHLDTLTMSPKS